MSYTDFLNFIKNGVDLFVNNIGNVANMLINNYIFITLLGLGIFSSLFIMFTDFLLSKIYSKRDKLDDFLDLKDYYLLKKEVIKSINSKIDKDDSKIDKDDSIIDSVSYPLPQKAESSELHK